MPFWGTAHITGAWNRPSESYVGCAYLSLLCSCLLAFQEACLLHTKQETPAHAAAHLQTAGTDGACEHTPARRGRKSTAPDCGTQRCRLLVFRLRSVL